MQQAEVEFALSLTDFITSEDFEILLFSFLAVYCVVWVLIYYRETVSELMVGFLGFLWNARHVLLGTTFLAILFFNWRELLRYFLEFYWVTPIALIGFVAVGCFFEIRNKIHARQGRAEFKRNFELNKLFYAQLKERERKVREEQERKDFLEGRFVGFSPPKSELELEREKREMEKQWIQQQIDSEVRCLDKSFYLKKQLTREHVEFLKENGFVEARLTSFRPGRSFYLVAGPPGNESIKHFFLAELIAEEIRHYTDSVETYSKGKPDVVFDSPRGRIAVEVETGNTIKKDRKRILRKIRNLKQFDGFFFVVTDSEFKQLYAELAPTFTRFTVQKQIKKCFSKRPGSSCAGKTKLKMVGEKEKVAGGERRREGE